jgi:methylmalonyl-CoA mutase
MTENSSDELALGAEFPAATGKQWRELVSKVLKDASFESRLVAQTYDGLRIEPLYPRKPHATLVTGRRGGSAWTVMQRLDHPQAAAANSEAVHDLANGATGLSLEFTGAVGAYGFGLAPAPEEIAHALEGIDLASGVAFDLDLAPGSNDTAREIAGLFKRRGGVPAAGNIRFGLDPIGAAAVAGGSALAWAAMSGELAGIVADLADRGFQGPFATADGRVVHNAGGSEAQELAYAVAVGVEYLRALEGGSVALDAARRMIYFRLAADADQFLTTGKFRALRKLWGRIEEACGLTPAPAFVAAETAWRMMSKRDPYVNMLRTTVAVASAAWGGADAITVLPFTMALGLPDRFARRIARNTQLVLLEESSLARVADPAAGSGGMEDLTDQLCRAAWQRFQQIEKAGGAWAALQQGEFQRDVAPVRAQRRTAVALRKDVIIGTSDFADLAEMPVSIVDVAPSWPPARGAEPRWEQLAPFRLAEPFEALRDAADQMCLRTGARPKVFLANLGPVSEFGTRAAFAKNFFEAGGIEAPTNDGFTGAEAAVTAFRHSGARLACLCSSDQIYAREASVTAKALRNAGASVWLAGRPGTLEAELRQAGVSGFIFTGCDVLEALQAAHSLMAA